MVLREQIMHSLEIFVDALDDDINIYGGEQLKGIVCSVMKLE